MQPVAIWITMAMFGLCIGFIGGFMFGGPYGMMAGFFSGIIMFMPILQMFATAKQKGFLPLYKHLGEKEKFVHFPDNFGKLKTLIFTIKSPGVLYKKGIGRVDDKGTEYAWGSSRASFGIPRLGITADVKASHYTKKLELDKIYDYDSGIKTFLGNFGFKKFKDVFRQNPKPDINDINDELEGQLEESRPDNKLEKEVFGETWSWTHFVRYLKYAFDPTAMENAIEQERIWVKREQMGYRDTDKNISRAKAIAIVAFVIIIVIAVLSSLDLKNITGMFG